MHWNNMSNTGARAVPIIVDSNQDFEEVNKYFDLYSKLWIVWTFFMKVVRNNFWKIDKNRLTKGFTFYLVISIYKWFVNTWRRCFPRYFTFFQVNVLTDNILSTFGGHIVLLQLSKKPFILLRNKNVSCLLFKMYVQSIHVMF